MPFSAESFYRAKISQSILSNTAVPFPLRVSKLPTLSSWLLTISPNTEYEEIVEYNNPQVGTMTIDIIKRGIKPSSILLTTNGVDYNNTTYQFSHTQNDVMRGDVNHIHINQGIGNSTLATNLWVGISKLSVAAVDAGDPIVVGNNDPRVSDSSTTNKWVTKLSVAPVSAVNPIACWDNDPRLTRKIFTYQYSITWGAALDGTFRNLVGFWTNWDRDAAVSASLVTWLGNMTGTITNRSYNTTITLVPWEICTLWFNYATSSWLVVRTVTSWWTIKFVEWENSTDLTNTRRRIAFMNVGGTNMTVTFQVADATASRMFFWLNIEVY